MIRAWAELRVLATLRRIAKAMERANELEMHRQELEYPPLAKAEKPKRSAEISHPTVQDWNQRRAMKDAGIPNAPTS
jgi:hypothetical protein